MIAGSPPDATAGQALVLSYARSGSRAGLAALLGLDRALGMIVRTTREPLIGQMRLTWWHDALTALDSRPPPAEPLLRDLAQHVVPAVAGTDLAAMVDGWEELLDPDLLDEARLAIFAERRGAGLFAAAGVILGAAAGDPLAAAGRGWALADLAAHVSDATTRDIARAMARASLSEATAVRWSRPARALGAMAHLTMMTDASPSARVGRALWHRLTGR